MNLKSNYKVLTLLIFLGFSKKTYSQEKIVSDRPDLSESTFIQPLKTFQAETGTYFVEHDSSGVNAFQNIMIRYGLGKTTELRLVTDLDLHNSNLVLRPVWISFKQKLFKESDKLPSGAIVAYVGLPFLYSKQHEPEHLPVSFILAFQKSIKKTTLSYNIGASYYDHNLEILCTYLAEYSILPNLTFFLEYFTILDSNSLSHNADFGILYNLSDNIQLDIAFGTPIYASNYPQYLTLGFSYKFNKKQK